MDPTSRRAFLSAAGAIAGASAVGVALPVLANQPGISDPVLDALVDEAVRLYRRMQHDAAVRQPHPDRFRQAATLLRIMDAGAEVHGLKKHLRTIVSDVEKHRRQPIVRRSRAPGVDHHT